MLAARPISLWRGRNLHRGDHRSEARRKAADLRENIPFGHVDRRGLGAVDPGRRRGLAVARRMARVVPLRILIRRARALEPGHGPVRRAGADLRHCDDLSHSHGHCRTDGIRNRVVSDGAVSAAVEKADRRRRGTAGGGAQHHIRHLGLVCSRAGAAAARATLADPKSRRLSRHRSSVQGTALRDRHSHGRGRACHHGAALHRGNHARCFRYRTADAQRIRLRTRGDDLGSHLERGRAAFARRHRRRSHVGSWARARRNHGRDVRDRQRASHQFIIVGAGHHHLFGDRQRVHRSGGRHVHLFPHRAGAAAVLDHLHRDRGGTGDAAQARTALGSRGMNRRVLRKIKNGVFLSLSLVATLTGLACLAAILWTLISHGVSGMSGRIFTQMTPPPGGQGGLLNAIYGSGVMTLLGILIGSPIGVLAGTYLAEYGRNSRLSVAIRFINDVLLSAPSIIIGLFIYEIVVVKIGHFSALAGALALAVLAIPVTLRTTEDMLNLVPIGMKDSSAALGAYPWRTIVSVLYPAARSGIVTGLLLAIARISGETAPLLFTALNNQFWSTNLNAPMANLPVVIFQFALSPYKDWQQLAWSGALIITVAILILSVIARVIVSALPG